MDFAISNYRDNIHAQNRLQRRRTH